MTLDAQYERLVDIAEINFEWTCSAGVETVFYLCRMEFSPSLPFVRAKEKPK